MLVADTWFGKRRASQVTRNSTARKLIAALSVVVVLAGCASVRPANPLAAGVNLDEINDALAGRMVVVRLIDGSAIVAHDVSISRSSVSFRRELFPHASSSWPSRNAEVLPVSDVRSVEISRRGMGALQGSLLGFGVGAAAGAAIGGPGFRPEDSLSVFTGAVAFGLLGSCLGFLMGASLGASEVYDLTRVPETGELAPHSE